MGGAFLEVAEPRSTERTRTRRAIGGVCCDAGRLITLRSNTRAEDSRKKKKKKSVREIESADPII